MTTHKSQLHRNFMSNVARMALNKAQPHPLGTNWAYTADTEPVIDRRTGVALTTGEDWLLRMLEIQGDTSDPSSYPRE